MIEDDLPEDAKIATYVLGAAKDLQDKGLITGSVGVELTAKGIASFDQLKASGYKPSNQELKETLEYFCGSVNANFLALFRGYRDGKLQKELEA